LPKQHQRRQYLYDTSRTMQVAHRKMKFINVILSMLSYKVNCRIICATTPCVRSFQIQMSKQRLPGLDVVFRGKVQELSSFATSNYSNVRQSMKDRYIINSMG
jgi:hypothetical protein